MQHIPWCVLPCLCDCTCKISHQCSTIRGVCYPVCVTVHVKYPTSAAHSLVCATLCDCTCTISQSVHHNPWCVLPCLCDCTCKISQPVQHNAWCVLPCLCDCTCKISHQCSTFPGVCYPVCVIVHVKYPTSAPQSVVCATLSV